MILLLHFLWIYRETSLLQLALLSEIDEDKIYYDSAINDPSVLFVSFDTAALISSTQNETLHSWNTMSAVLQYYYTKLYHNYDYIYYTLNGPYNKRNHINPCIVYRNKSGDHIMRLHANYCKILMLYDVVTKYADSYDYILYLDSDAFVRTFNRTFKGFINKHFITESANDYAMIFLSQGQYDGICTGFIIMPMIQKNIILEMIISWWSSIKIEKNNSWLANGPYLKDQAVFNNQIYTNEKYKHLIYEINEPQLYDCKHPEQYYKDNPYFIHFHSFLRRTRIANKCGTYDLYYQAMKDVNIYDNITNIAEELQKCCVTVPNFTAIQEKVYS